MSRALVVLVLGCSLAHLPGCSSTRSAATEVSPTQQQVASGSHQYPGYRVVQRDGQTLYCDTKHKTGSRIQKETECLTEQELLASREANQRAMSDITQKSLPPPGH